LFLLLAAVAILAMQTAHGFFPGDRALAHLGRLLCLVGGIAVMIIGSRWLLKRDGLPADRLGLAITPAHGRAFLIGSAVAVTHILLLLAALHLVMPFELQPGPLPARSVAIAGVGYLAGNFVEELLFRGYLLIVLAQWLGTARAIWLLALPFGLFHFPGLDLMALGKMILTTGAMHFVYAYAFLATRSLWSAVALHAVGNTLLHEVVGVGNPAALSLHYSRDFPTSLDLPFLVFFGITALLALVMSRLPATRRGQAWLESTHHTTRQR
jgi:hypothetical protein